MIVLRDCVALDEMFVKLSAANAIWLIAAPRGIKSANAEPRNPKPTGVHGDDVDIDGLVFVLASLYRDYGVDFFSGDVISDNRNSRVNRIGWYCIARNR